MIAGKLLHIEWLKARRRFAFLVTLGTFFAIIALTTGGAWYSHLKAPGTAGITLPEEWKDVASGMGSIASIMAIVLVALLTGSERTWRTERQNVIDGLTRDQFFAAKLLLIGMVAVIMWSGTIAIVATFGALDRTIEPADGPLIDAFSMRILGGLLLRLFVVGTMAFFFSMVTSGSGAALAFSIVFLMAQEPLILALADKAEFLTTIAPYSLTKVLESITNAASYNAEQLAKINERIESFGFGSPMMAANRALLVASIYAALFSVGAWLSINRRDL